MTHFGEMVSPGCPGVIFPSQPNINLSLHRQGRYKGWTQTIICEGFSHKHRENNIFAKVCVKCLCCNLWGIKGCLTLSASARMELCMQSGLLVKLPGGSFRIWPRSLYFSICVRLLLSTFHPGSRLECTWVCSLWYDPVRFGFARNSVVCSE